MKVSTKTPCDCTLERHISDRLGKISYGKIRASDVFLNSMHTVLAVLYIHHNDVSILLWNQNHVRHRTKGTDVVYAYFAESSLF